MLGLFLLGRFEEEEESEHTTRLLWTTIGKGRVHGMSGGGTSFVAGGGTELYLYLVLV